MIEKLLFDWYGLIADIIEKAVIGAGSDTYFITCSNRKYVLKFPCTSEMNNPQEEPELCGFLLNNGISVSEFVRNNFREYISEDGNKRPFHLQKFIDGRNYELNKAPQWFMRESAQMLGKIHTSLMNYKQLPEGIGTGFFKYMTPQNALKSYEKSLTIAQQQGDKLIENGLLYRIELMKHFPDYRFNVEKLSCKNTHGDYFISQMICGEDKINAVIDWTTACVHPVVWEIIRSFVYADPCCAEGEIDIGKFVNYVGEYLNFAELNSYDIATMPKLFYYQISVCDYYNQYYKSSADNRHIYLHQAIFSTKLIKWFEKNIEELSEALINNFAKRA